MLVQFAQMGSAYSTARYGVADPSVALLSIGEEKSKGTASGEGDPRPAGRHAGPAFRRERRGPRPDARRPRRGRHRRVHRQRGPQDPGGVAAVLHGHPARRACPRTTRRRRRPRPSCPTWPPWPPSSTRTTPGGPFCSAWTGSASSATARPRPRPSCRPSGWPTTSPPAVSSTASPTPWPRRSPVPGRATGSRPRAGHRGER